MPRFSGTLVEEKKKPRFRGTPLAEDDGSPRPVEPIRKAAGTPEGRYSSEMPNQQMTDLNDWGKKHIPSGVYSTGHEFLTGMAEGVGDLPNIVPNVSYGLENLSHQLFGTAEAQPHQPWFGEEGRFGNPYGEGPTIEELNPQTPGYEGVRQMGKISGSALPAGVFSAATAPFLVKAGEGAGDFVDTVVAPNQEHKYREIGSALAPLLSKSLLSGVSKALPLTPVQSGVLTGLVTGGDLTQAATAAGLQAAVKGGARTLNAGGLPGVIANTVMPLATVEDRKRKLEGR